MFSAALQNQLIQTRVYDRHRQAAESSRRAAARRQARSVGEAANEGSKSTRQDHRRTYRFLRHYVEMVVVMFAGMFILMVPEHVGMLACMLVAMLLRRDEYSCAKHHHDPTRPAVAA